MKKLMIITLLATLVVAGFGAVSYVSAQAPTPPGNGTPNGQTEPGWMGGFGGMMGRRGMQSGAGPIHEYMLAAVAEKLDMTSVELQAALDEGKTMWQVAQEAGYSDEEIQVLMQDAHTTALDAAVAAGALTEAQAEQMGSRMQNMPGGCNGQGGMMRGGGGGMMRGGRNNG